MSTITAQFDMHTRLFNNVLSEIGDSEANKQTNEHTNHIKWLAGHLVNTRLMLKDMAGLEADERFDIFGKTLDPAAQYPSLDVVRSKWNDIADTLSNGLKNLPAAALESPAPTPTPIGGDTMGDFLGFLMHHEAYHLGQLGILRKSVGKDAMSYK